MKKKLKRLKPSDFFKNFDVGDKVLLIKNSSYPEDFPKILLGKIGTITKKLKNSYEVKFLNGKVYKRLIIKAPHLKKIK